MFIRMIQILEYGDWEEKISGSSRRPCANINQHFYSQIGTPIQFQPNTTPELSFTHLLLDLISWTKIWFMEVCRVFLLKSVIENQ